MLWITSLIAVATPPRFGGTETGPSFRPSSWAISRQLVVFPIVSVYELWLALYAQAVQRRHSEEQSDREGRGD
jgi:hypothetical protein